MPRGGLLHRLSVGLQAGFDVRVLLYLLDKHLYPVCLWVGRILPQQKFPISQGELPGWA